ncbi:hypothetical protein MGH68_14805 [Erysipelothrix sp. D19-032]
MNDRVPVEYDFSGQNIQTYKFHDDTEIMKSNIALTESFLDSLGDAKIAKGHPERVSIGTMFQQKMCLIFTEF